MSNGKRKPFDLVVEKIMAEPDPRKAVDQLLRSAPPGHFQD
jgi:hypothetical protein